MSQCSLSSANWILTRPSHLIFLREIRLFFLKNYQCTLGDAYYNKEELSTVLLPLLLPAFLSSHWKQKNTDKQQSVPLQQLLHWNTVTTYTANTEQAKMHTGWPHLQNVSSLHKVHTNQFLWLRFEVRADSNQHSFSRFQRQQLWQCFWCFTLKYTLVSFIHTSSCWTVKGWFKLSLWQWDRQPIIQIYFIQTKW